MTACKTFFEKPPEKLTTYKEKVPAHNPNSPEYGGENTGPFGPSKIRAM
jgi:hypothetical protein